MANDTPTDSIVNKVEALIKSKDVDQALVAARDYWLAHPTDPAAPGAMAQVLKALGRKDSAKKLNEFASKPDYENPQGLFEAGYALIDERELQLACELLSEAAKLAPNEAVIRYELGFALMSLQRFGEAIEHFEKAVELENDFDTRLNLSVCYAMERQLDKARNMVDIISELASSDEEHKEVKHRRHVLKRFERLGNRKQLSTRDWLYALYGSLLIHESSPAEFKPEYTEIARTLLLLKLALPELGFEFDVIEYYSALSRPMAEAFAHLMELPVQSYKGERKDRALLMMAWAPNIVGPHKSFIPNDGRRVIFAFALSRYEPLPLTPDIVGYLTDSCTMPWAETIDEKADDRDQSKIDLPDEKQASASDRILNRASQLESTTELILAVEELLTYYSPKVELVVGGNAQHFSERPEYTAEIPF